MLCSPLFITLEFILLCCALPTYIWMTNAGNAMFGFLWAACLYCFLIWFVVLRHSDRTAEEWSNLKRSLKIAFQDFMKEWNWGAVTWANMRPILLRWVIATILILAFTFFYEPDRFLYIPLEAPGIIPFLILAYPILSALPQEFIFCSFFMRRYGQFMKSDWIKIVLSALVFGYAHMLFINWVAPVFSFFGGLIFAYTYIKTRSLSLVTIEHSLYGNSIFLAGIGYYFYSGGIGQ